MDTCRWEEASIAGIQEAMSSGSLTSEQLVLAYLERIARYDRQGPKLNAVLEVNPDALFIAQALDRERRLSGPRGPLHGIPVLLKDNIDTHDKLHTSAGSLALADSYAPRDAFIVDRLRNAGAVILGKANMTEFANFMTDGMPSGYSSRGGQVINPYLPDFTPSGSSSGPAVAVAANLTTVAVGTETSGSILSPASNNSVVGIKPTVGLVSRTGIIPIAMSQDTAGPMARTVADAAVLLGALAGPDPADPATWAAPSHGDYTRYLERDGLRGARIGVPRRYFCDQASPEEMRLFEEALAVVRDLGAVVVDPAEIPSVASGYWESNVLTYEFKAAINAYLAALGPPAGAGTSTGPAKLGASAGRPVRSLREIIEFNDRHPEATLKYGQTLLTAAEATSGTLTEPEYLLGRLKDLHLSRTEGIDAAIGQHRVDALLFPECYGDWISARAGYPSVIVPAGYTKDGAPVGVTFAGTAWSEPALIRFAYAYEQATRHRVAPRLEGA